MLLTDLREENGNNGSEMISKGSELHFNPAAASLQMMATMESVICLEAESQYTAHVRSAAAAELKSCFKLLCKNQLQTNTSPNKGRQSND